MPRALLQRRLDWKWLNLTEIIQLIVVSVASLALAFAGLGSEALILGAVIGAVAVTVVLLAVAPAAGHSGTGRRPSRSSSSERRPRWPG